MTRNTNTIWPVINEGKTMGSAATLRACSSAAVAFEEKLPTINLCSFSWRVRMWRSCKAVWTRKKFHYFYHTKKLKFYHTAAALAAPPYSYSPWKTTQICAKKLRLKRNSCGATGSQSCGGSHGQTSFITSYIVVGIVVKRVVDHRFSILTRSAKSGGQGHFWWFRKRTTWFQNFWKHTNHVPNHMDHSTN